MKPHYNHSLTVLPNTEQTDSNLNISPNTAMNTANNHPNPNSNTKTPVKLYENSTTITNHTTLAKQSTSKKSIFLNNPREVSNFYYEDPDYIPNTIQTVSCSSKDIKIAGEYKVELIDGDILSNNEPILITPNDIIYFYINNHVSIYYISDVLY